MSLAAGQPEGAGNGIMIDFENVDKFALSDFSLHIPAGERVGLIGGPGSGKTTLLKLACGLLVPERGSVRVSAGRISAYIAGLPLLDRDDTVRQSFELTRCMYRIPKRQFAGDYEALSARLSFRAFEREAVKTLSLGQRVRAELGAALIVRPEVLLLDEPNAGLDESGKAALREILTERGRQGLTVLVSSSDMVGIAKLCTRFVLLEGGKAAFYGSERRLRSCFAPIDRMTVVFAGRLPDMEDLPLKSYSLEENRLTLAYNSNHVTAAEILKRLLGQTEVVEVKILKPTLEDVRTDHIRREDGLFRRSEPPAKRCADEKGEHDEFHRGKECEQNLPHQQAPERRDGNARKSVCTKV
ncbi:MAG: ATP-binding cassette domain-containing protein [Lachnospiraceae bacterium]|nr:ATP-binding cassette domain-containing protein [Lachnospiraceae bacterium]